MATAKTKTKFTRVDPKKIRIPSVRITSVWDPEEYEDFKSSIDANGITNPIICVKENDTWWLSDGKHRLEEALLNGEKRIDVAYKEGTLLDAKLRNLYLNRLHGKTKASEEVQVIKDLYENEGLDLSEIAERTGWPLERIDQRLAIGRADPYVQEMLDDERIGIGIAFELSRLPNPKGQIRILQEIVKMAKLPPTRWVKEIVDGSIQLIEQAKNAPPPDPVGPPIRTLSCGLCEERYADRDMVGVNVCRTCYGLAKDHIQQLKKERARGGSPESNLINDVVRVSSPEVPPP